MKRGLLPHCMLRCVSLLAQEQTRETQAEMRERLAQLGLDVAVHSPENLPLSTSPNRRHQRRHHQIKR